jgi:hypothetical protein
MNYIGILLPAASLIILLFHKDRRDQFDNIFALFLLYTVLNESISLFLSTQIKLKVDSLYNIYSLAAFLFFISMFKTKIRLASARRGVNFASAGLIFFFLLDSFLVGNFFEMLHFHTYVVGTILLIGVIAYHFMTVLESEEIIYFYKLRSFWVSLGLLLFYVPFTPLIVCLNYEVIKPDTAIKIIIILNFIMHISFWIGYLRKSES